MILENETKSLYIHPMLAELPPEQLVKFPTIILSAMITLALSASDQKFDVVTFKYALQTMANNQLKHIYSTYLNFINLLLVKDINDFFSKKCK
jgi:hypothetical protein